MALGSLPLNSLGGSTLLGTAGARFLVPFTICFNIVNSFILSFYPATLCKAYVNRRRNVCLSVCPSQSGNVSKSRNASL